MLYATKSLVFAPLLAAVCVVPALGQGAGVPWRSDFREAQAEAQKTGKLVLAHFWTETCGPCRLLEQRVFTQPAVATAIESQYVPVKVNANEFPEIAKAYGVTRVPTDVVVAADGAHVNSFVSPGAPMEYVSHVTRLANAYRTQSGGAYAAAAAAAPAQPASYETMTDGRTPYQEFAGAAQQLAGAAAGQNAAGRYAPTAAAPPADRYASAPAAPVGNRYADITPEVPAVKPQAPPAAQANPHATVAKSDAPQLPPGSPPLGFEGYCPVTMKQQWQWTKGDTRWGAIHNGRTYLFASADAQKAFLASPDEFSPVLSGSDPVSAVDERRSVPGVREFAVEYKGRFYMFSSEKSLETFWSNPSAYADGVRRVASLEAGAGSMVR